LTQRAIVLQFESVINADMLAHVLAYQAALSENKFPGLIEIVPSYCSITIYFDLLQVIQSNLIGKTSLEKIESYLQSLSVNSANSVLNVKHHVVPVCYDLRCGLDLPELSKTLKLSVSEIIDYHINNEYTVYLIGFTPGFPYLGTLPAQLECKRKNIPRKKVPQGSVALAGKQTGIYPFETPGGWQIVGRTPVQLFSVDRVQPSLFMPGDTVKFEPISFSDLKLLEQY
jgi:inhibitor of KinA